MPAEPQQGPEPDFFEHAEIGRVDLLDHRRVDWTRVRRSAFLVHQHLRYEYPASIRDLKHRLVIVPPEVYGDQRLILHRVTASAPGAQVTSYRDHFGNLVYDIRVPRVMKSIDFECWSVLERSFDHKPHLVPSALLRDRRLTQPSALTEPDAALEAVAAELGGASPAGGLELAERINDWVFRAMTYTPGVTDVETTAADALLLRRGVCQDYSHLMLALCRLSGITARYVSGHLLGEGGTHAWVEVLVPSSGASRRAMAIAFDPTHGRRAGLSYVTVAVGADYSDVAPTSGTFEARSKGGALVSRRKVALTAIDYHEIA